MSGFTQLFVAGAAQGLEFVEDAFGSHNERGSFSEGFQKRDVSVNLAKAEPLVEADTQ